MSFRNQAAYSANAIASNESTRREFAEQIVRAFPEWANALESPSVGQDTDDCSFCVRPPRHPTHRLYVLTRGNSVEVRYDDGEPPAPAEKLFVDLDEHPVEAGRAIPRQAVVALMSFLIKTTERSLCRRRLLRH